MAYYIYIIYQQDIFLITTFNNRVLSDGLLIYC